MELGENVLDIYIYVCVSVSVSVSVCVCVCVLPPNPKPVGGIQIIACGDFFQLPPVRGRDEAETRLCFESRTWEEALPHAVLLEQV